MNKKEILELKRRFKKENVTFTRLVGCYVDANRNKVCKFGGKFLNLEEEEFHKYLEIANKTLSGTKGNNLVDLEFPMAEEEIGGRQQILMALRDSKLEDENLLDAYYDLIIDTYDQAGGNYLILMFHDVYDVMTRTSDNDDLDESEEVYEYLICAICPVALSKPGLGYLEDEKRIGPRIRDWVVGAPDTAFLFPAFNDRSADVHSCLFYTKNTKEPHSEFMSNGLGCDPARTATEQKMAFHSIVRNALGTESEDTEHLLVNIQEKLEDMVEEYNLVHEDSEEEFLLEPPVLEKLLVDAEIPEDKANKIEKHIQDTFGDKPPVASNVIDSKAIEQHNQVMEKIQLEEQVELLTHDLSDKSQQLETTKNELTEAKTSLDTYESEVRTYDVILRVKPEKAGQIHTEEIAGKKCLVIPMEENEHATINGVNTQI